MVDESTGAPQQPRSGEHAGSSGQPGATGAPAYGYHPEAVRPHEPANGYAIAGLVTSSISLTILLLTAGILSPITLVASAIGTALGHKGRSEASGSHKQRDLAEAGFWVGVAGIVLSVLAVLAWAVVIVLLVLYGDTEGAFDTHRQMHWD